MSFLALSTAQALLLAALTVAAVLVLYFLKLRHRRVVVGSSLLWERVLDDRESRSIWEKLRRWVSLLITLTIALLVALALGRPYLEAFGGPVRPVIIVLDTSVSMETRTATGRTRWERATDQARQIVEASNSPAGFMVADTAGRVETPLTEDRGQIIDAIDRMQPFAGRARFPRIPLAETDVYFITDGVDSLEVPASVTMLSVFERADNVGITAFEIRVDPTSPSGYAAYLEVVNYSAGTKDARILLTGVGGQRLAQDIRLGPGETWSIELDLADFEGGGMRVGVQSAGDALALDDVAFSYLPIRQSKPVTLVTASRDGYLETLLRLSARVELTVVRPADFQEDARTDIYVFEDFVPQTAPSKPSLVFGSRDVSWLPRPSGIETDPVITSWEADHRVMRSVPVYDLKIDEAAIFDLGNDTPERTVVAASDRTPLILIDDGPSRSKTVLVGFDLASSDFPFHVGFPIFVENVVAWFSGERLAERYGLGEIELPAETTTVTRLDGTEVPTENRFGSAVIETMEPDLFTVTADGRRVRVAANLTDRRFSNINQSAVPAPSGNGLGLPSSGNELWFYMLLMALLLVGAEWWTYHHRITL